MSENKESLKKEIKTNRYSDLYLHALEAIRIAVDFWYTLEPSEMEMVFEQVEEKVKNHHHSGKLENIHKAFDRGNKELKKDKEKSV